LGQLDAARGYSDEARRRAPEDFRLHVLAAIITYRSSDLAAAERELRSALEIRHGDPVASLGWGSCSPSKAEGMRQSSAHPARPRGSDPLSARARRKLAALRTR
jgi:hypothetical protein